MYQLDRSAPFSDIVTERSAHPITAPLRDARSQIRRRLRTLADRVGALATLPLEERGTSMASIAADLEQSLRPHLEWEERIVHPIVDRFACEGPATFSASMRYEHEIIYRGLGELRGQSLDATAAVAFMRRADNLLGVVSAHFELEEEVLFPVLDRALARSDAHIVAPPPC